MPPPPNTTSGTAIVIPDLSTPYSNTQQVDDAGTTFTVWYKYVAVSGDKVVGLFPFGDLAVYRPRLTVFSPNDSTVYLAMDFVAPDINKRVQFPVIVGDTYFFRITPNAGNPAPANLTVSALRHTESTYQAGDLFIPVDVFSGGFASAILDPTVDHTVRKFIWPFPFGEGGDILNNGLLLMQKNTSNTLDLYDTITLDVNGNFTLVTNVAPGVSSTLNPIIRTILGTQRWMWLRWNTSGTSWTAKKIDDDGTILQTWTFTPGASQLAGRAAGASNDEAILYYTATGAFGTRVKRYDLIGSAGLSDLNAGVLGYGSSDILVLADGSIVVDYAKGGPPDLFIRRYAPDGTILNTYTTTNYSGEEHRLAYDIDVANFWQMHMINSPTLGLARFKKIRASDGAVLVQHDYIRYDRGMYSAPETATPLAAFGDTNSCPFVVLRGGAPFGPPNTIRRVIRRLRATPHISAEQSWLFYYEALIDLETGVGIPIGQGEDPQVMLRWSDDGGHTWSSAYWVTAGRTGDYTWRATWRRLGRSRDRVFEIVVSDPVKWRLLDVYLDVKPGRPAL